MQSKRLFLKTRPEAKAGTGVFSDISNRITTESPHTYTLTDGRVVRKNNTKIQSVLNQPTSPRRGPFGTPCKLEFCCAFVHREQTKQHERWLRNEERKSAKLRAQYHRHQAQNPNSPTSPNPRRSTRRRTAVDRSGGIPIASVHALYSNNHPNQPSVVSPKPPCLISPNFSASVAAVTPSAPPSATSAEEQPPAAQSALNQQSATDVYTPLVPYADSSETASLAPTDDLDYATTIRASLYSSPWDQLPTHRWWTTNLASLEDVPAHRRNFYPKIVVPQKDLKTPDAQFIAERISALDPKFCTTANMTGLNIRRKAIDGIHE